jgi:hypothetical protein
MIGVGSKVKCIDASIKAEELMFVTKAYRQWIQKDAEYTIRKIFDNDGIVTGCVLEEIVNGPIPQKLLGGKWQEPAFRLSRFVECEEAEMEVSIEELMEVL